MNRRKPKSSQSNWTDTGSFANRPPNGWLHPTELLNSDLGVTYQVRYMGSIVVFESMKSLDFDTRTALAKECIYRICSTVYPKACFKKSKQPSCLLFTQRSLVDNFLADIPDLQFAEVDVHFTISVDSLSVVREDNGNLLYHHRMQTVSFASEGDGELVDFIAYIAKDDNGRKCHVIECSGGLANEVITTVGQAFEIRFKQHLYKKQSPAMMSEMVNPNFSCDDDDVRSPFLSAGAAAAAHRSSPQSRPSPSSLSRTGLQGQASVFNFGEAAVKGCASPVQRQFDDSVNRVRVGSVVYAQPLKSNVNNLDMQPTNVRDDMTMDLPPARQLPYDEQWFHGKISRQECEKRLLHNGDFLVRESPNSTGQFVLSGRHEGDIKHLLLVDPEGRVRTKDQLFTSVSHLVNYHFCNSVPIIAIDSELLLLFPVHRPDVFA